MNNLLLIGELSEKTGISKRMLRHFDQIGLLLPVEIDENNGYRLYQDSQIGYAKTIVLLQQMHFSLQEINQLINHDNHANKIIALLKSKEVILRETTKSNQYALHKLSRLIDYLDVNQMPITSEVIQSTTRSVMMTTHFESIDNLTILPGLSEYELAVKALHNKQDWQSLTLVYFDIDNFGSVNEKHGFAVGDAVILQQINRVSNHFNALLQSHDSNEIYRFGGDELTLLLLDCDFTKVKQMSQAHIEDFSTVNQTFGAKNPITCSIGIVHMNTLEHPSLLKHHAHLALIQAKRTGRNQLIAVEI